MLPPPLKKQEKIKFLHCNLIIHHAWNWNLELGDESRSRVKTAIFFVGNHYLKKGNHLKSIKDYSKLRFQPSKYPNRRVACAWSIKKHPQINILWNETWIKVPNPIYSISSDSSKEFEKNTAAPKRKKCFWSTSNMFVHAAWWHGTKNEIYLVFRINKDIPDCRIKGMIRCSTS